MASIHRIKTLEEERAVEMIAFCALRVEKKNLSFAVRLSSRLKKVPSHLKYVHGDLVLICGTEDSETLKLFEQFDTEIIYVPKYAPKTEKQAADSRKLWPCYFFPPVYKKHIHESYIKELFEQIFETERRLSSKNPGCSSICLFYDPKTDSVRFLEPDTLEFCGHAIFKGIEKISMENTSKYLCTNLIIFCLYEPCFSCAVALIHARIDSLYFLEKNTHESSILGHRFNHIKSLNHKYESFQVFLPGLLNNMH